MEGWLLEEAKLDRFYGVPQLCCAGGEIVFISAKLIDGMFISGSTADMKAFILQMGDRLSISKAIVDDEIEFNVCDYSG